MSLSTNGSKHTTGPLQSPLLADAILDNAGMLVVVHDLAGRILRFNQACERLTGYTQDEVLNRPLWDFLLLPEEIPKVQALFKQLAGGQSLPNHHTNYWLTRAGQSRLITWSNTTIPTSGAPVDYIVSIGQDVTETNDLKQRANETQDWNEKILAAAPIGIVVCRVDGQCILANEQAEQIMRISRAQLLQQNFRQLESWKQSGLLQAAEEALATGQMQLIEIHTTTSFNHEVWLVCRLATLRLQGQPHLLLIMNDVSQHRKAVAELRETEIRYRTLVEQIPAVTYIAAVDEKSSTLYYSPQVEEMLGYTPSEMGQSPDFWLTLIHPDDRPGVLEEIGQVISSGRSFHHEFRMRCKDGREIWVNDDAAFVHDEQGQVLYQQGVMFDITGTRQAQEELERRVAERTAELRESEERFRTAFEQAAVGIAHVAPDQRFLRVNQRLCAILGYSQEELLSLKFGTITYAEDLPKNLAHLQRMLNNESSVYAAEKRYIRKDGSLVWVNLSVTMVRKPGGEPDYFVTIIEDITARKQAQAMLEERTRDLARSNDDLEQFAYITSHDLQEPLRMVTNFAQLLARRYLGQLDARADDYIHYITEGAQRMNLLVTDLLAYSRVGTRGRPFVAVESEAVLAQVLDNLQLTVDELGAQVTHDPLPMIYADEIQLVQLLQNLISNAIKFRSSAPPRVHVSAVRRDAEWVFSVRDNGIGIDPQYFERIFIIFQRLHLREEYPGTGIGLAICKKIIERHGGRIWVESNPDQGSTFFFSLPWNQFPSS